MEQTINERVKDYIRAKNMSVNSFSKEIGILQATLNAQVNGTYGVATSTLCAIAERYPDANMRWFLTGEGEMEVQHVTQHNNSGDNFVGNTNIKGASAESLLEIIKNLQEQNTMLINIIGGRQL